MTKVFEMLLSDTIVNDGCKKFITLTPDGDSDTKEADPNLNAELFPVLKTFFLHNIWPCCNKEELISINVLGVHLLTLFCKLIF